ncbi:hypothetical protein [Citrobacter amalonaticus]
MGHEVQPEKHLIGMIFTQNLECHNLNLSIIITLILFDFELVLNKI